MRLACLTLLLLAATPGLAVQATGGEDIAGNRTRPNVLLIIVDDLNDQVGFLGDSSAVTPKMDALANASVVFDRAYAQAPLCNPSRTSFLTGTYPHTTGIYGLKPSFWEVEQLANLPTLPLHFRNWGYYTGTVGKVFHVGAHAPSFSFEKKGRFGAFGPFPPQPLNLDPKESINRYYDWGPHLEEHQTADFKAATAAIRFIGDAGRKNTPFFLSVGFFRPHVPLFAPAKYFDLHPLEAIRAPTPQDADLTDIPDFGLKVVGYKGDQAFHKFLHERGQTGSFIQAYQACVSLVDEQVGRVLHALEESELADNTIVVLISDHGVQNGRKNMWFKRTLWEASTRVPMTIRIPGTAPRRLAVPVGLIDLFPTLAELAGLPQSRHTQEISLTPWLALPLGAAEPERNPVLSEHGPGNVALRDLRWRYIRYEDGSEELYDHDEDPDEIRNLVAELESLPHLAPVLERFRQFIPRQFSDFAPGSRGMNSVAYPGR